MSDGGRDRSAPRFGAMSTAIVTGASRGLGLALATELPRRGWRLVIDARGEDELEAARGRPRGAHRGRGAAGRHVDARRTGARSSRPPGPRIELLVNNAGGLGPSPLPPLERYPLAELEALYRVNVLAPLRLVPARAAAARRARGDPQRHLRRRRRGLRGLGRLRLVEGRARAAHARARRRAAGPARVRGRPGRHAHADAPGRLPGRGHLGPAAARRRAFPACSR